MCVRAGHRKPFHSSWECLDLCNTCICVCMRWQVTDANGTAQAKFSDLHMATAYQHKTQSSHFNFSHWCWALGQGVLTFYNTHMCVCTDGPSCSHSFCPKKTLSCLHKGVHDHLTKLMFTDVTVAALLEPRSSDLHHTHVCAGSPQEAISFWKLKLDHLGFATHAHVCKCWPYHITFPSEATLSPSLRQKKCLAKVYPTQFSELISLVLGARPRRPDLLQHTSVCTVRALASQAHDFWRLISQFRANGLYISQDLQPAHRSTCSLPELMSSNPSAAAYQAYPTHTCAGSPWEAISKLLQTKNFLVFATRAYVCMRWRVTDSANGTARAKLLVVHTH